jgi:hypothetical protein
MDCTQSNIEARLIEGLILSGLLVHVFDPDETRAEIEKAAGVHRERAEKMLAEAERRLRTIERKRGRVLNDYLDENLSAGLWEEASAKLEAEARQAEAHAAELREAARAAEVTARDLDAQFEVVQRLEALQALIQGERHPERVESLRQAISTTFQRIYLEPTGARQGEFVVIPVLRQEMVLATGHEKRIRLRGGDLTAHTQVSRKQPLPPALARSKKGQSSSTRTPARTNCKAKAGSTRSSVRYASSRALAGR